jgi:signal transduction histidine kinase/PAS domain-containing protein
MVEHLCIFFVVVVSAVLWRRARNRAKALARECADLAVELDTSHRRQAALRQVLDVLPLPVWRRDGTGAIIEQNRAFAALGQIADAAGRSSDAPATLCHIVVDGRRRLFALGETNCDDGGSIGFGVDRTEIEAAETELWRHVNAQGAVLESIRAGVAIYGADRRLRYFNTAFVFLWGLDEDWLETEPKLEDVLEWLRERRRTPEHIDFRAYKLAQQTLFTELIEARQEMLYLPDGRTVQLSIAPHPLGGLVFLYEDVTDHLALESSFNTLAQVQRATLDHLFEGIAVFGADGRLRLHNPAYRALWDLSEDNLAGGPHVAEIVEKMRTFIDDGSDWEAAKAALVDRITAQVPGNALIHRGDGSMLQAATVPLPDGEVLLTYLDVSDSARVEQALRERNEALETADRLKSEFIANVSYDLRTPLNALLGFTEVLSRQYFGHLNERQLEYTRHILESGRHLSALIGDILDLATIEAGYMRLDPGPVDVPRLLKAVASLAEERARSRDLDLIIDCAPEIGRIEADERRLKQALFNLVSNAIKFTPPGGTIRLEAETRDGDLVLGVADSGIGIEPTDHRPFSAFERGMRRSGAGLGLSLVKKLIELHGGTVGSEMVAGHGTRVFFRLPSGRRGLRQMARHKTKPTRPETLAATIRAKVD